MSEIVKICKNHGDLTRKMVYEEKMNNGLTFRLRCSKCVHEYRLKNIEKLREKSREYEKTKRIRPENHYEDYVKKKSREWRQKNSDLVNKRVREYRKNNTEKYLNYDRNWRANNLMRARELDVVKKHDITYEEYKFMFEKQDGKCYICNKEETKKSRTSGQICRLAIDHNHDTGKIRKLLCHNCNIVVGHCKESIEFLERTIDYLKEHKY